MTNDLTAVLDVYSRFFAKGLSLAAQTELRAHLSFVTSH